MARARNGQAIRSRRRTPRALARLRRFMHSVQSRGELKQWRRAKAVVGYIEGQSVCSLASQLEVTRGSVNRWLQWYDTAGIAGLRNQPRLGRAPRLSPSQRTELSNIIEAGPQPAGFCCGVWTGPMVGELIRRRYGVHYHNHHVPRLLHQLGFSVQRPRKRLAKADADRQAAWLQEKLPRIKKKRRASAA